MIERSHHQQKPFVGTGVMEALLERLRGKITPGQPDPKGVENPAEGATGTAGMAVGAIRCNMDNPIGIKRRNRGDKVPCQSLRAAPAPSADAGDNALRWPLLGKSQDERG